MRALIYLIPGLILLAAGLWWMLGAGFTVWGIVAMIVVALGGALTVTALGVALDQHAPTSRKN